MRVAATAAAVAALWIARASADSLNIDLFDQHGQGTLTRAAAQ